MFHGLGANAYGQVVIIVVQLAGVPILLHYWGVALYGEWLILFAIPAYLSITDLGFSQSAANDMTARVGRGDYDGALSVFQTLTALVYAVSAVSVVIAAVAAAYLPFQSWFNFAELAGAEARWVLWVLATAVLIKLADGVNAAGFRAGGEYALHRTIEATTMLIQHGGIWIVAVLGHGPLLAAIVFLGVRMLVTPSVTILMMQRHPYLQPGFAHARIARLRGLAKPALANIALPVAQALNIQGMVLVVGAMLGPSAVVTFSTLRTLTRLVVQSIRSVSLAVEPELARSWGRREQDLLRKLYLHSFSASLWMALASAAALHFLGGWIVGLWTGGQVEVDIVLFDWLILSAVASVFWFGGLNLLRAANQHLRATIWFFAASLMTVVIAAVSLRFTGNLASAGLSLLLMDALMIAYVSRQAISLAGVSAPELLMHVVDPRPVLRGLRALYRRVLHIH